jgi:hypothetical protein
MLSAAYAYLHPQSVVYNNPAYRERLFVLLDHRLGLAASGSNLRDIGWSWQAAYAYLLLKHHRAAELTPARIATYEAGLAANNTAIISEKPLIYEDGVLAQVWLNGDVRLAMSVYFAGQALGDANSLALAEKARAAIDGVMTKTALADGGTRYVGFWGEVASYHEDGRDLHLLVEDHRFIHREGPPRLHSALQRGVERAGRFHRAVVQHRLQAHV